MRSDVQLRLGFVVRVTTAFDRLADAGRRRSGARHDALIVFVEGLQASALPDIQAAAHALHARRSAVVYSFATTAVTRAFAAADISLLRGPVDDARLGDFLSAIASAPAKSAGSPVGSAPRAPELVLTGAAHAKRRYDDAALADFAGLSTTIACECPRHLAEIVMKLSHFEAYSAQCQRLDSKDAALHTYLGQVTATARSMFEAALERLAMHEGLVMPHA